jgi:hypothetical protein
MERHEASREIAAKLEGTSSATPNNRFQPTGHTFGRGPAA